MKTYLVTFSTTVHVFTPRAAAQAALSEMKGPPNPTLNVSELETGKYTEIQVTDAGN